MNEIRLPVLNTYKIKWYGNTNLSDDIWIKMPLILLNKYKTIMLQICITEPHLNIKMSNL